MTKEQAHHSSSFELRVDSCPLVVSFIGLSNPVYQRRKIAPKNIQVTAPKARSGPKGNLADHTGLPTMSVISPMTDPRREPAKRLNNTARHPRNAPIAARNFRSPD